MNEETLSRLAGREIAERLLSGTNRPPSPSPGSDGALSGPHADGVTPWGKDRSWRIFGVGDND
jgi:hypothetical protein